MKNYLSFLITIILFSCSSDNYKDVSSNDSDIKYYKLVEKEVYDDNGSVISFSIPNEWRKMDDNLLPENVLAQYELIENTGYSFSVEKLESRNTVKLDDKRYLDITLKAFQNQLSGDLDRLGDLLPELLSIKMFRLFNLMEILS